MPRPPRSGLVAKLVTDNELAINKGRVDGVVEGMEYAVLDRATQTITDPSTGVNLGSVRREKVRVVVTSVGERASLARRKRKTGSFGAISQVFLPEEEKRPNVTGQPARWPEGAVVGDPVELVSASPAR